MMKRPYPMPADGRLAQFVFVSTGVFRRRQIVMVRSKPFELPKTKGGKK